MNNNSKNAKIILIAMIILIGFSLVGSMSSVSEWSHQMDVEWQTRVERTDEMIETALYGTYGTERKIMRDELNDRLYSLTDDQFNEKYAKYQEIVNIHE